MAAKPLASKLILNQLLRYDEDAGRLFWLPRGVEWFNDTAGRSKEHSAILWNKRYPGQLALDHVSFQGYREGHLLGVSVKAHRVIWKMLHDSEPPQIDHIDGDRANNRLSNLVAATNETNTKNAKKRTDNTSGVVGVSWYPHERVTGKWLVRISNKHIGMFDSFDDAVAARRAAEVKYGFHENHGRR